MWPETYETIKSRSPPGYSDDDIKKELNRKLANKANLAYSIIMTKLSYKLINPKTGAHETETWHTKTLLDKNKLYPMIVNKK